MVEIEEDTDMARYQGTSREPDQDENAMSDAGWWAARDRRIAADVAADRTEAATLSNRLHRAQVALSAAIETGDTVALAAANERMAALRSEEAAAKQSEAMRFTAAWTLEVTTERRATWNARVRSGEFNGRNGKADLSKVSAAVAAQGWTLESLKVAIKLHGLA